ncbi:MAG: hypothetical protein ACKVOU_13045, partial [Cytophagales bacterium]
EHISASSSTVVLRMGLFDFNPFQGKGSGKNQDFLDEQWEAQQAILKARQSGGLTKDQLQNKYKKQVKDNASEGAIKDEPRTPPAAQPIATSQSTTPSFAFFATTAESDLGR